MNVFIDTSVVYTDSFWKRNLPSQLLKAAIAGRLKIYFCDVVLRELRRNFEKQLDKELSSLFSSNTSIKKISRRHDDIIMPDKEQYLIDFDNYYTDLFKQKNIIRLPTGDNIFDEILERAIEQKKPFTDNRSEFKDAVIWTTYYKYAKTNELNDCHLLTNNKKDFTNNEGKLHPELSIDYNEFDVHITIDDFYKIKRDIIDKPIIEFQNWISKKLINEKYVFGLLSNYEVQNIYDELRSKFENLDPNSVKDEIRAPDLLGGYVDLNEVEWSNCEDIEIDVVSDYAIVSGILKINILLSIYGYNSSKELGDDKFPFRGEVSLEVKVYFNFLFDKEEIPKDFEVTDVD